MTLTSLRKRLGRISIWFGGSFLLIGVSLFVLQRQPAVQRFLTTQAESYLAKQLQSDLGIGSIRWQWPTSVEVQSVYLNHPAGDTLLRLGRASVDIHLWALIRQRVVLKRIEIADLYTNFRTTDSTSNIDFLLAAFADSDTATVAPDTDRSSWEVQLSNTEVTLSGIDAYYQDGSGRLL